MTMAPMVRGEPVVVAQIETDAGRDRFLADGHMQRARNFTGLVRLERGLLEGADARHGPIKVSQAAEIVARIAHCLARECARLASGGFSMFEHAAIFH